MNLSSIKTNQVRTVILYLPNTHLNQTDFNPPVLTQVQHLYDFDKSSSLSKKEKNRFPHMRQGLLYLTSQEVFWCRNVTQNVRPQIKTGIVCVCRLRLGQWF